MKREFKIALSQEFYSDVVYLSQYDTDYDIEFTVLDKYAKATGIDGHTAKFTGTRCDGLGFTFDSTASGETVSFEINTSLTAISGTHKGEIVFYDTNGLFFGSANVQIVVEPAARPDGTIDADVEQAQEIADQIQEIVDTAAEETTAEARQIVADLEEDVAGVKEDLTDLGQDNIAYMSLVNDHKILTNTLVLSDNRLTSCTDYIRVPEDAYKVEVATKISTNVYILPQCFFFDENKSYISRNSNQTADYATFEIPDGTKYIRVNQPSSNDGSPRLIRFIKYNIRDIEENAQKGVALENDNSLLRHRASLTAADDMNNLAQAGAYFFTTDNKPANSPTNLLSRPVVIKSAAASNHSGEAQFIIQDGVFYFRSKEVEAYDWNDWKSYGLGAPVYQQETLPYNAVTYHAKWDALIQDRVLRRVNLGYVDNDSLYPMYAYEFCPQRDMVVASGQASTPRAFDWSNALYQRPKILIIGGVHGNEKCTPMDIYAIAKMLLKRDSNDVACKFDWYFIPLVNPWGYSHARLDSNGDIIYDNSGTTAQIVECTENINAGIRNNAHDQNINRDWSDVVYTDDGVQYGFQTPELQLIKNYVLGIAPDFFIDAHQNHANVSTSNTNPVCCHAGAPINSADTSNDYAELMRKIYRHIDIANADTDKTMLRYANHPTHKYQACRIWDTLPAATSEHYFAGVTALNGSTVIGNTQHGNIATSYSICTETSEICATYAKSTTWYNPVACTFSCTYLWNIIKQIASLF